MSRTCLGIFLALIPLSVVLGASTGPSAVAQVAYHGATAVNPQVSDERKQEMRYELLFLHIKSLDEHAAHIRASGDAGMATAWENHLERQSGLTHEQAEQVKRIASKCLSDVQENSRQAQEALHEYRDQNPNASIKPGALPINLQQMEDQRWTIVEAAIQELISTLGTKGFASLDQYDLHRHDTTDQLTTPRKADPNATVPRHAEVN